MDTLYKHKCIKPGCSNTYEDNDVDAYYCDSCKVEKERIAKEVDAKVASRVSRKQIKSDFQIAEELGKTIPSASGGLTTFVRASDLGL